MVYEDADATLLRLFESFMESAPQLVLQIYILIKDPHANREPRSKAYRLSNRTGLNIFPYTFFLRHLSKIKVLSREWFWTDLTLDLGGKKDIQNTFKQRSSFMNLFVLHSFCQGCYMS